MSFTVRLTDDLLPFPVDVVGEEELKLVVPLVIVCEVSVNVVVM